ncbi:hypothetical protein SEA_LEOPARD_89 [Mycobacterium phage Leopard]|uniref:Uncharacterized protein n=1 Tax=Mycobacterium phage Onyinye TaxID=2686235 RepID=A0A6B9L9J3_9CAUD|nr:hypothetical protein PP339_gp089 [Mycobacterium phage Onyinye]QHB37493.1 hypothetical protein SEA_ONYINYE_89 [Mycobacterium phage Onyinye]UOW92965.1 hypothetical protein SEA_LEOPARD_89 [Mycobacterium phage Leopard]
MVEFKPRANANPYTCWCEHHEESHDIFGCRACDKMGRKCQRFRSKASTPPEPPKDYADEIKKAGFINHNGDLATCSTCWGVVKLGDVHKVSAVINAKAHNQTYHEKPRDTSRPNRAG